jgi:flagellar hook protein FlgE
MATRSMLAAVSGIDANQTLLDEIANNIANADTVGYKEGTVQFSALLSEQVSGATAPTSGGGGVNPIAVGSGVRVSSVITDNAEGTLEATGNPTDVAIQGNGFLVVESGGEQMYTRDGALTVDETGQLTTLTGGLVQGWQATGTGLIDTNAPVGAINIPTGETIAAKTTTRITLEGNLPAWSGKGTLPQPATVTLDTYNPLGAVVHIVVTFTATKTKADTWKVSAKVAGTTKTVKTVTTKTKTKTKTKTTGTLIPATKDKITFDATTGALLKTGLTAKPTGGFAIQMKAPTTSGFTKTSHITLFFPAPGSVNAVTQFTGARTITGSQDGYSSGSLESYSISGTGVITGKFSNGKTMALGQIALATFANNTGLENVGNGLLATSANSGQAQIGTPGTGVRGTLLGGQLEQSNVNLGTQLTDLITAQEAYEANTKAISTSQQVIASLEQV